MTNDSVQILRDPQKTALATSFCRIYLLCFQYVHSRYSQKSLAVHTMDFFLLKVHSPNLTCQDSQFSSSINVSTFYERCSPGNTGSKCKWVLKLRNWCATWLDWYLYTVMYEYIMLVEVVLKTSILFANMSWNGLHAKNQNPDMLTHILPVRTFW